jgi:protocatechuate 3,4-dioxygenase beta subunit
VNSLPGRRARMTVAAAGFAAWTSGVLELPEKGPYELTARLSAGGVVLVRAQDAEGRPIVGARIERRASLDLGPLDESSVERERRSAVTDGAGRARFEYVPVGSQAFRIAPKQRSGGFQLVMEGAPATEPGAGWVTVDVAERGEHELVLVPPPTATLQGVVYEDGEPLGGARIKLQQGDDPMAMLLGGGIDATTDGAGRFVLEDVEPGDASLEITHPSRVMPLTFDLELPEGVTERRFDLPVSVVEGRVTDSAGEPVANAVVRVQREQPRTGGPQRVAVMIATTSGGDDEGGSTAIQIGGTGREPEARTDEDGRYVLRGVLSDVDLTVTAKKKGFGDATSKPFAVGPGGTRRDVDVVLQVGGHLRLRCAEPGMWIALARPAGEPNAQPRTGIVENGEFTYRDLPAGKWSVQLRPASPDGEVEPFEAQEATVEPRETAELTFER